MKEVCVYNILFQDRKPLTEEPKHDDNSKDLAEQMMFAEESKHSMEDFMEARLVWSVGSQTHFVQQSST